MLDANEKDYHFVIDLKKSASCGSWRWMGRG